MQSVVRACAAVFIALGSVVAVSASWAMATAIPLLAAHTTALIMGGTFHPLMGPKDTPDFVTDYLDNAVNSHLNPAFAGPVDNAVAVYSPEEFFPIGRLTLDASVAEGRANLHRCLAGGADCVYNQDAAVTPGVGPSAAPQTGDSLRVFGYSQSSVIASLAKRDLIEGYDAGDAPVSFMFVANPMRPNGGVLMRGMGWPTIPILGISFGGASPTDSAQLPDGTYAYPTVDIARQYDGLGGDFPVRPLNLIALLNAFLGYGLLHGETVEVPFGEARYQGREGDTSYYLIETDIVPLLQPLAFIVPKPILKALDAPLRVLIEDAYDREIGPGTPTAFNWWPTTDLFGLVVNLIKSIPVAVDNFFEGFGLPRVLGTAAPGTFGVGGPELPVEPDASESTTEPQRLARASDPTDSEHVEPEPVTEIEPGADEALPAGPAADLDETAVAAEPVEVPEASGEVAEEPESEESTPPELDVGDEEPPVGTDPPQQSPVPDPADESSVPDPADGDNEPATEDGSPVADAA